VLVDQLPVRLRAEDAVDLHLTVVLEFTDVGEAFAVEIRRGIAEVRRQPDEPQPTATSQATATSLATAASPTSAASSGGAATAGLAGPRTALGPLLLGAVPTGDGLDHPELEVTGDRADLERFFGAFDDVFSAYPPFFLR
jgi:alkyl sulfatase BDS1-like metallo-beta-lactamase superfamily hydrolase